MLRDLAVRFGLGATGAVYVALGVVTARVALLGAERREAGIPGALRFLLEQSNGPRILGAVVAGLAAIALVHLVEALTGSRKTLTRLGLAANGFGYATLAWTAAGLLFRLNAGGAPLEREGASWLLEESWGSRALMAAGLAVAAGGLWEGYQGVRGRLPFRRDLLPRRAVRLLSAVARFGLVARGLVLCVMGDFLCRAAAEQNPGLIQSFSGALGALSQSALGPALMAVVALGLAAYGIYLWTLMLLKRRV